MSCSQVLPPCPVEGDVAEIAAFAVVTIWLPSVEGDFARRALGIEAGEHRPQARATILDRGE